MIIFLLVARSHKYGRQGMNDDDDDDYVNEYTSGYGAASSYADYGTARTAGGGKFV